MASAAVDPDVRRTLGFPPGPVVDVEDAVISPESISPYPFNAIWALSRRGTHSEVQGDA